MAHHTIRRQIGLVLIVASLILGSVYPLFEPQLSVAVAPLFKGLGVGLLALVAALWARSTDGWLLAWVMAAGTAGDVLLALPGRFEAGAAAFAVGHVLAISLYLRNRRAPVGSVALAAAVMLLGAGVVLPRLLLPGNTGLAVYALLLTGMAAAAGLSRFDRRVSVGALMFVVSDALIAVRLQNPGAGTTLAPAIWWLYYFGQLLIFWFVAKAIRSAQAH